MEMAVFLISFAVLFLMGMPIAASMFTSSLSDYIRLYTSTSLPIYVQKLIYLLLYQ